jgi:uncharacterized protein (TIGR03437 family)
MSRLFGCLPALWILVLSSPLCLGQFYALTTNRDGRVLYFTTSLRQKGSTQDFSPKIFRVDGQGLAPEVQRPLSVLMQSFGVYALNRAFARPEGGLAAVEVRSNCAGPGCNQIPLHRTEILSGSEPRVTDGRIILSRSGRYGLVLRRLPGLAEVPAAIIDFTTGEERPFTQQENEGQLAQEPFAIADNGAVYGWTSRAIPNPESRLIRLNALGSRARVTDQVLSWQLDAAGQTAVAVVAPYLSSSPIVRRLLRMDLETGEARQLATLSAALPGDATAPTTGYQNSVQMSGDGRTIVVDEVVNGDVQLFSIGVDGVKRQLTDVVGGVSAFVLSDDGRIAWVATNQMQILKIDVGTGSVTEAVGRSVVLQGATPFTVGSTVSISGLGLASERKEVEFPLPESLGNVHLLVNGKPLRLQSISPTRIVGQVPWSTHTGPLELSVSGKGSSVFEGSLFRQSEYVVRAAFPAFLRDLNKPGEPLLVIHGDWRGLVSEADPAQGGEILHIYGRGFGPVVNPPADGELAPVDSELRTVEPIACSHGTGSDPGKPIDVLWSGLAPGTLGVYQITIRLGDRVPGAQGRSNFRCAVPGFAEVATADFPVQVEALAP